MKTNIVHLRGCSHVLACVNCSSISFSTLQWRLTKKKYTNVGKIYRLSGVIISWALQSLNYLGGNASLVVALFFMCLVSPFQFFGSSCSNRVLFYIFIFPERLTTTRPAQVTLPICCVGADTHPGSQSPIQSTAYEFSSSSVIPYTSYAYSDIQNSSICFPSGCFDKFSKGPCPWISGPN